MTRIFLGLPLVLSGNFVFALGCLDYKPLLWIYVTPQTSEECPAIVHIKILKITDNDLLHVKVLEILTRHTHLPQLMSGQEAIIDASIVNTMGLGNGLEHFTSGTEWVVFIRYKSPKLSMSGCHEMVPIVNGIAKGQISDETIETMPMSELRKRTNDWERSNFGFNSTRRRKH